MSQNKVKLVLIENKSVSLSNNNVETTRVLETNTKQDLVNCLISEAKRRNELVGLENLVSFDNSSRVDQAFANIFGNVLFNSNSLSFKIDNDLSS
ncbi:5107_t:CDS:2 [Dentiscutata heterogama]|uniref:5107_t:CDS:1 n=1 Tax=Dentiscutata heterogama TaxID=1316150 RepID=A0ACA9M5T9_9GLOM|nr:5107_t:CDS:2 [Dentiscutata heterogama]